MTTERRGVLTVVCDWTGMTADPAAVTSAERLHCRHYPPWRRREWLTGRLTARSALALACPGAAATQLLRDPATGAPRLLGLDGVTISLSHTGSLVACSVSTSGRAVGVDVERAGRCGPGLARRVLAPDERPPAGTDLTTIWSIKEAAYKAMLGAWPGLRSYRVRRDGRALVVGTPDGRELIARVWDRGSTVLASVFDDEGHDSGTPELVETFPEKAVCRT